jgi:hypothetical protein
MASDFEIVAVIKNMGQASVDFLRERFGMGQAEADEEFAKLSDMGLVYSPAPGFLSAVR